VQTEPSQQSTPAEQPIAPPRPEIGPEHNLWRRQIEAVLFGGSEELSFGRYRLLHRIGEGGMGSVYAAYDEHLERKIAVKLIRPSRLDNAELRERTLREARALARLSHPNVVHVYEAGEVESQLFVAMEFLAGPTLRAWLDGQRRPWREVVQAFCQAGEGLAAAHAQGIIHRDFKPHNAMFGADGRVRTLDFGLARLGGPESAQIAVVSVADPRHELTLTGALLGTPAYMAPEQIAAGKASAHSDQFSFCVALFEALYGHRPFVGATLAELMDELTAGRGAARPRETDVPRWVHAVLVRGLAVEPERRWPSMRELLAALRRDPGLRRRRVVAGVLMAGFVGAVSFALARPSEPSPDVCPDARDELAVVWDRARANEIAAEVRAKHGARAEEVLAIVVPQIDRYAEQWAALRNQACRAHAQGQQSSNVFDARTACLDERLASLEAIVQVLARADAEQLDGVAQAASGLPALERCADVTALLAAIPPPEDPETRARVQAHRETLARAQVHEDAGQDQLGLELVAKVLADEQALAYQPLLAEAYLRKGCLEMATDPTASEHSLAQALWVALATGHATVAAQASSKRGFVHAAILSQYQRALDDVPMITALNQRVIDDVGLYAEYLNNVGNIYLSVDDWLESRRWLEQARDLRVARAQPMDWRGVATLSNLGIIDLFELRNVEAYAVFDAVADESLAVFPSTHRFHISFGLGRAEALFGAGRPRAGIDELRRYLQGFELESFPYLKASVLGLLGLFERECGDVDASREHLLEAHSLMPGDWKVLAQLMRTAAAAGDGVAVQAYQDQLSAATAQQLPSARAFALGHYGVALRELGATREAVVELERARSLVSDGTTVADGRLSADLSFDLGGAYRELGDHEAAERELERAYTEMCALFPAVGPTHAHVLRELGELALDRGRFDEARTQLEQAASIYLATAEPDYLPLARTRFALARALTGANERAPIEAGVLAEAALIAMHANRRHVDAHAVEAWLRIRAERRAAKSR
jgi:tRNA A-37 threonylcarbamoyl transferase component Bud32/tetratricopeptide (TPR) repeat protein